jgi:hypothetical protein
MLLLDHLQNLQTIETRSLQPDIEKDEVGTPRLDLLQRFIRMAGGAGSETLVFKNTGNEFTDIGLVVNNQNISAHSGDLLI